MRCDLHVHTIHSGMCTVPVLNRVCRESYNDPHAVYETLKRRGMDVVTVTDHDSIDAAERLRRHADFFLSEEVSCRTSSDTELHIGVYGLNERDHIELQRRRTDFPALLAHLRERGLLFSVNHAFSSLTGRRKEADFREFAACFPAAETRNGMLLRRANLFAARFARRNGLVKLGGSDSHTLTGLGRTFTEVPGARTPEEFLAGLRAGWSRVCGESGNYWKLTGDVLDIGFSMIRERPWTALLAPLCAAVPLVTLGNMALETAFAYKWGNRHAPRLRYTGAKGVPAAESLSL
ncbi:MAG TPA: PHP domain-containing protein [Bryobacteraceae bacterium]|nr:PHP domain-containing protein [Bryobacteraceae bacterium]